MKKLLLLLYFFPVFIFAQEKDSLAKYNLEQLFEKADQAIQKTHPSIKIYSEEIIKRNPHDSIKARAFHDIGDTYYAFIHNDLGNAIKTIEQSIKYAQKSNSYHLLKQDLWLMAYFYISLHQNEKALKYVDELNRVHDPNESYLKSLLYPINSDRIYGTIGDFKREAAGYRKLIKKIDRYVSSHPNIPKETLIALQDTKIYNCAWLITNYSYQKKLDSAAYYISEIKKLKKEGSYTPYGIWSEETFYLILRGRYDDAIKNISASQKYIIANHEIYISLYYLAVSWQEKKEYKKSLEFCEKAIAMKVKTVLFLNPELELYRIAAENAEKLGDLKKTAYYSKKYIDASQKINYAEKAAFIAKLYDIDVIDPLRESINKNDNKTAYLYATLALLALSLSFFIFKFKASQKEKKKFKETIARLEQNEALLQKNETETVAIEEAAIKTIEKEPDIKNPSYDINELAEKKILVQLSSFEKKRHFLKPDITLTSLASDFGTNVVYLSKVVKKHKNNNFSNYINQLKIDYVILQLKTNPIYKNYKVAFWAEDCGIPYSTFVKVFSQQTGTIPSRFIEYLEKNQS